MVDLKRQQTESMMKPYTPIFPLVAALLLMLLHSTEATSTRIIAGHTLTEFTGAQQPPQLMDSLCQPIDTSAACDIVNGVIGGCVAFGEECSSCTADAPGNTPESEMCYDSEGDSCEPSDTGDDNTCGTEMVGSCIFDINFELVCRSAPGPACGDIKVTGC